MTEMRTNLYFYHGLDEKEIAKAEGVTQQMVSKSLDQAMKNLKGIQSMQSIFL